MKKLLPFLFLPFLLFAKTSLWKITNGDNTLYLGGTIHILRSSDYPLPAEFDTAYNKADIVVLETDLSEMNTPDFQSKLISAVSYPKGKSLLDDLTPDTYLKLSNFLEEKGIPISALNQFRPPMVSILLTQWEITKYEMAEDGVDMHYFKKMHEDKKSFASFETIDQQINFISSLGEDDYDGLILNTIEEMTELPSTIEEMISSWKTGDTTALNDLIIKEMVETYPSVYKSLIVDRNKNWVPEIIKMLSTSPIELILVGAGHLVGSDGLLQSLKSAGYMVHQVEVKGYK